jgi:hypothetical protein
MVPMIGPSIVPIPPIRVTKMISAENCTLNTDAGWTCNWLTASSAPAAPHPSAATRYTIRRAVMTRAPAAKAPSSSSRTADRTRPSRLRSNR